MSDETPSKLQAETTGPEQLDEGDTEAVLDLVAEVDAAGPAIPSDAALEELKTEVLSAVRGAITDVMSRHQPYIPEPDLDLDFSLKAPAEDPSPELVVAEPAPAQPEVRAKPDNAPNPILAALAVEPVAADAPVEELDTAQTVVIEALLPFPPAAELATSQVPVLTEPSGLPMVSLPPVAPIKSRLPAWTAAALLSVSGIAIGAGAAILLVDPSSTAELRKSFHARMVTLIPSLGEPAAAPPEITLAETAPLPNAAKTGSEIAVLDRPALTSEPLVEAPVVSEPLPAPVRTSIGTRYPGAPVIALAPVEVTPAPVVQVAKPDLVALVRAVEVATAAQTAAFVHAISPPDKVIIPFNAARRVRSLDTLAALPAPAAVTTPVDSGTEASGNAKMLAVAKEPAKTEPVAKPKPATASTEQPTGAEPTEPVTPLSAMARANEALRNGDVEKARLLLQSESEAGQVEAMLVLARTFDPSYLKELGVPAAKGNAETAEKLYRAWYDQSVKLGLVSEGINLNRLIRAMARAKP